MKTKTKTPKTRLYWYMRGQDIYVRARMGHRERIRKGNYTVTGEAGHVWLGIGDSGCAPRRDMRKGNGIACPAMTPAEQRAFIQKYGHPFKE